MKKSSLEAIESDQPRLDMNGRVMFKRSSERAQVTGERSFDGLIPEFILCSCYPAFSQEPARSFLPRGDLQMRQKEIVVIRWCGRGKI